MNKKAKKIIICLDIKDEKVSKGVHFENVVSLGDPVEMAKNYSNQGVDELVFYDIMASSLGKGPNFSLIQKVKDAISVPLCVGGGISSIEDIKALKKAGIEKISINSPAVKNPLILVEAAKLYGKEGLVLGIDAKKDSSCASGYRVMLGGGKVSTDLDVLDWAKKAVELGAGEIVLNSIDADGTKAGYDIVLTKLISENLSVPVVASGGGGTIEHIANVLTEGKASAALIASIAHKGILSVPEIKTALRDKGIPVL